MQKELVLLESLLQVHYNQNPKDIIFTNIIDLATAENKAHALAECSNAGVCDRSTGRCICASPWTGTACDQLACPNKCSGHGQCVSMADMTKIYEAMPLQANDLGRTKHIDYGFARETSAWDAEVMHGNRFYYD